MALTPSNMLPLGTMAPDFVLQGTDGQQHSLASFANAPVLVVMFICNHCPFVKHVRAELARLGHDYHRAQVAMIAINSNDTLAYPADDMEHMKLEVQVTGYPFPYLLDESQAIAKAYGAACTPDFFVFDSARRLVYRGQLDDSRPNNGVPVTGMSLREAIDGALAGQPPLEVQKPSIGCNIKWRPAPELVVSK